MNPEDSTQASTNFTERQAYSFKYDCLESTHCDLRFVEKM